MTEDIFNLLKKIASKGHITLVRPKYNNRNISIKQDELYSKLKYLCSHGFTNNISNKYIITEYGYSVAQFDNWNEYLVFQKEVIDKKIKKERLDFKISEFQIRTKLLPYFISGLSIILSAIALFFPDLIRKEKIEKPSTELNMQLESKQQDKSLAIDTIQTNMASQKNQEYVLKDSLN